MNSDLITGEIGLTPSNPLASQAILQAKADGFGCPGGLKGLRRGAREKDRFGIDGGNRGEDGTAAMSNRGRGSDKLAVTEAVNRSKLMDMVPEKNETVKMTAGSKRKLDVLSSEGIKVGNKVQALDVDGAINVGETSAENLGAKVQQATKDPETLKASETQLPASSAGWESFLPQRNIKVLLAEDDDSTRHVVGALLRNCSYEVTCVSNGMQAWEMLEDQNCHFDLVLTDVVMPHLSGVGLLSKILSREGGERTPVIMMSAHDSLDIVFRCLSKGAADFLVKPVRKNELKNLWQHVWRCQSSSGSGSGGSRSGSAAAKAVRAKSRVGSGNNSASNDRSDDNSSGLNVRGGSDNGSGTQAAPYVAQKPKLDKVNGDAEEEQATSVQKLSNEQIMGQELEMATRRDELKTDHASQERDAVNDVENSGPSISRNSGNACMDDYDSDLAISGGSSAKAIDLIGGIAYRGKDDVDDGGASGDGTEDLGRGGSNSPENEKCTTSTNSPPVLELTLKRSRAPEEKDDKEERSVLRHSGSSAFSRYSITSNPGQLSGSLPPFNSFFNTHSSSTPSLGSAGNGQIPSFLERGGSSKVGSMEASASLPLHPKASHAANGQDTTGSSAMGFSAVREGFSQQMKDEALSAMPGQGMPIHMRLPRAFIYDGLSPSYGPGMHPVFYAHAAAPPWASAASRLPDRETFDAPPYCDHAVHPTRHSSLPHHQQTASHRPRLQQGPRCAAEDEQVVLSQMPGAPRCGSSNGAGSVPDSNGAQTVSSNADASAVNTSVHTSRNGSATHAAHAQNGQNGEGDGNLGASGAGNGLAAGEGNHELNRSARREAALNKFRQKRKDRCFEKKVRYQSRKRLAEQRPRVRGQFVRQAVYDSNTGQEMD